MSPIRSLCFLFAFLISGCAARGPAPVIDQSVGGSALWASQNAMGALATTASYRTVNVVTNAHTFGGFCPEPPPDVAQSIFNSISASIQAEAVDGSNKSAKISAEQMSELAEKIAPLIRRTQGLQFYRDGMYYICVAYLNSRYLSGEQHSGMALTKSELMAEMGALRQQAYKLMLTEVQHLDPITWQVLGQDGASVTRAGEQASVEGLKAPDDQQAQDKQASGEQTAPKNQDTTEEPPG